MGIVKTTAKNLYLFFTFCVVVIINLWFVLSESQMPLNKQLYVIIFAFKNCFHSVIEIGGGKFNIGTNHSC